MKKAPHNDGAGKEYMNALNKRILRRCTAIVIPFPSKDSGFTVRCPQCGMIHLKAWKAATQRGPSTKLCGECLAWGLHQ